VQSRALDASLEQKSYAHVSIITSLQRHSSLHFIIIIIVILGCLDGKRESTISYIASASSHLVSSRLVSSRFVFSSHLVSSCLVPSRLASSRFVWPHLFSSDLVSSHLVSSRCFVSSCPVSSRLVLSCLVLSCLVLTPDTTCKALLIWVAGEVGRSL
jgi:hypothetical protein